jgi:hypothetical protein
MLCDARSVPFRAEKLVTERRDLLRYRTRLLEATEVRSGSETDVAALDAMSVLHSGADIVRRPRDVGKVP